MTSVMVFSTPELIKTKSLPSRLVSYFKDHQERREKKKLNEELFEKLRFELICISSKLDYGQLDPIVELSNIRDIESKFLSIGFEHGYVCNESKMSEWYGVTKKPADFMASLKKIKEEIERRKKLDSAEEKQQRPKN